MHIKLSSSRKELAQQLFLEIDKQRSSSPMLPQRVIVPEHALLAWLFLEAASVSFSLLDIDLTTLDEPVVSNSFVHYFGFRTYLDGYTGPQTWYLFSPCGHFWSDLVSERELGRAVARTTLVLKNRVQESLESFYSETNSLLSNAAILGRKCAQKIDSLSVEVEASYPVTKALLEEESYQERVYDSAVFIPKEEEVSLLRRVQADLIFLVGTRKNKLPLLEDGSLRIYGATTLHAEVASLVESIQQMSSRGSIALGDVLILTPTPSLYEPIVRKMLPQLTIQSLYEEDPLLVQRMRGWFSLISSRFDKKALLSLISLFEMKEILECDEEEIAEVRQALHTASFTWGIDGDFRKKWLIEQSITPSESSIHTDTLHELFLKQLYRLLEIDDACAPLDSSWKILVRFISLVERLSLLWQAPCSLDKKHPISFWIERVEKTIEEITPGFSQDDLQLLSSVLYHLLQEPSQQEALSIQSFFDLFLDEVGKKTKNTQKAIVGHILIGSLKETIPFSARFLAFLGMGDEDLSRFISQHESEKKARAQLQEQLNYAVLDGLMQAKEKAHFSYIDWDFELRKKKDPGFIVALVKNYVESQWDLSDIHFYKKIAYSKKKKSSSSSSLKATLPVAPERIEINHFISALSNPLSYYMRQLFGQKRSFVQKDEPLLFASKRHLEKAFEKELIERKSPFKKPFSSVGFSYPREVAKGVSSHLLEKEIFEVKKECTYPFDQLMERDVLASEFPFSKPYLEGSIQIYSPPLSVLVRHDVKQAIMGGLWATLTLLSFLQVERKSVWCVLQNVEKELLSISKEDVESFFLKMSQHPFPFLADLMPTILGEKASFITFEEALLDMVLEKDPLAASFNLITTQEERRSLYPVWQEYAEKLILPWIEWGATL